MIIILGAGIIGLFSGYNLLKEGKKVKILDSKNISGNATDASVGMLSPAIEARPGESELYSLMKESKRNRRKTDHEEDPNINANNESSSYLRKKMKWKSATATKFQRIGKNKILYELKNLPTEEAIVVKVRAQYAGKGY